MSNDRDYSHERDESMRIAVEAHGKAQSAVKQLEEIMINLSGAKWYETGEILAGVARSGVTTLDQLREAAELISDWLYNWPHDQWRESTAID